MLVLSEATIAVTLSEAERNALRLEPCSRLPVDIRSGTLKEVYQA